MSYTDASDEETAEMKQKVRELHWGQPEEEEKGMVFDEDEFIEEDVLQILKDGFNVRKQKSGKKIAKEKGKQMMMMKKKKKEKK